MSWMNNIASRVSKIECVKTVREPRGLSNHSPTLSISWDVAMLNITSEEVARSLRGFIVPVMMSSAAVLEKR
jgi:hypothetical protein